jgi:hypothetical protein
VVRVINLTKDTNRASTREQGTRFAERIEWVEKCVRKEKGGDERSKVWIRLLEVGVGRRSDWRSDD